MNDINLADYPTLQSALDVASATGRSLYVPPGKHTVHGDNYASGNIRFVGDTSSGNQLVFENGARFIYRGVGAVGDIPDTANSGQYNTTQLVFERVGICVTGNSDKVIDAQWSNSGNSGTLAPTFTMRDCRIYAVPASGTVPGRWDKAIYLAGASNIKIDHSYILGGRDGLLSCTFGVYVDGSVQPAVEFFADTVHNSYCNVGYYFAGHVEGINLINTTTLECNYNVIDDTSSNPHPGGWPMLYIADSHMSSNNACVLTTGVVQIDISHNLLYCLRPNGIGLVINSQDVGPCILNSGINDNTVINTCPNPSGFGIIVNHTNQGKESLDIGGVNTFQNFDYGVYLGTGVDGVNAHPTTRFVDCTHNHS